MSSLLPKLRRLLGAETEEPRRDLQEVDDFYDGLRPVIAAAVDGAKAQEPDGVEGKTHG